MMRAESVLYFRFNKTLYLYSIIAATLLLSRYLFGALYRPMKVDPDFTPGVTIIIPCFNEETWIDRTILAPSTKIILLSSWKSSLSMIIPRTIPVK